MSRCTQIPTWIRVFLFSIISLKCDVAQNSLFLLHVRNKNNILQFPVDSSLAPLLRMTTANIKIWMTSKSSYRPSRICSCLKTTWNLSFTVKTELYTNFNNLLMIFEIVCLRTGGMETKNMMGSYLNKIIGEIFLSVLWEESSFY